MKITIYVEGGGDTSAVKARCREGFQKLLEKAGFAGRMPRIVACGGRESTFDDFRIALRNRKPDEFPMLLVDSKAKVDGGPWEHLYQRDRWVRPDGAEDDHVQMMVQCMETWIMADRAALRRAYLHQPLRENALFGERSLEDRNKDDIQDRLAQATQACPRDRRYEKGKRSFQLLAELDPATLEQHLPSFRRLRETLNQKL